MQENRNFVEEGFNYANQVIKGDIFVAEDTKLACQRFLDYFVKRDWDFYFHQESAQHILEFVNVMVHVKGPDAGKRMMLHPFQVMVLSHVFGFLHKGTHRRMVQDAILFIPRKQGKSFLISIICLYLLLYPNGLATMMIQEAGTEIYVTAFDRIQAKIVFQASQALLDNMPKELAQRYKLMRDTIHKAEDRLSLFTTLSRDAKKNALGKGALAHIIDEAAIVDRDSIQAVNSGMIHRASPLRIYISTAHFSRESLFFEHLSFCQAMLRGQASDNPRWFYLGYMLPEGLAWTDPKGWYAACPLLGTSIPLDAYEHMCEEAQNKLPLKAEFLTRNLNVWTSSSNALFDYADFDDLPREKPDGEPDTVAIGVDLARNNDLNSVSLMARYGETYWLEVVSFLPKDSLENVPLHILPIYEKAIEAKKLILTDGNVTDINEIMQYIVKLSERWDLTELAYDPWNAMDFLLKVQENTSLILKPVSQGMAHMSAPSKEFYKLIKEKRIGMAEDPFFTWQAMNVTLYTDVNDNWKFNKEDRSQKIDSIISAVIAIKSLMDRPQFSGQGFYLV